MLSEIIIKSRYTPLVLAIIGYVLALWSVIIFLNVNNIYERILWGITWLICCNISDHMFKIFKNYKKENR